MSKSVARVEAALADARMDIRIHELGDCRTAADAAASCGCALDQIAKSILFRGEDSGMCLLFLTAGGNRVDPAKAAALVGEGLGKADAALVRQQTGFAIGGVSPVGHPGPLPVYWDPRLSDFNVVWAAAGTPRHVFAIAPGDLLRITGAQVADFTL